MNEKDITYDALYEKYKAARNQLVGKWMHIPLSTAQLDALQRGIKGQVTEDAEFEIIQPKRLI
jgi:hypothetical protein